MLHTVQICTYLCEWFIYPIFRSCKCYDVLAGCIDCHLPKNEVCKVITYRLFCMVSESFI